MKKKPVQKSVSKKVSSRSHELVTRGILNQFGKTLENRIVRRVDARLDEMKSELGSLRDEMKNLKNELPTKHDLAAWKDEIITAVKRERHEFEALEGEHQQYEIALEDRITAVERDVQELKRAR